VVQGAAMTDLVYSFATIDDVPRVAALIELAYRGAMASKGWTNETALLEGPRSSPVEVERLVREPRSRFLMAIDDHRLVACCLLQQHGQGAYFGMFAVHPDRQQQGLGKAMIAHSEEAARVLWKAKFLRLTVISLRDTLIAWYQRRGFKLTGEHEPFPFDEAPGALRTDFDLVVLQKPL
jgi:ribosomal protein S18 acetylase RimI-like enzyme